MAAKPRGIAPQFLAKDVRAAAEYYRDKLGFEIGRYFLDPPVFVILQRDGMALQLSKSGKSGGTNRTWKGEAHDAYIWVDDADEIYRDFVLRKADLDGAPVLKPYGMREFEVRDLDGHVIRFGADVDNSKRVPPSPNR